MPAMVLGILSFVVFCWLGPAIGLVVSGGASLFGDSGDVSSVITVWPVWAFGLGIGVFIPLIAVIMGISGMRKADSSGVALVGIVVGTISLLIGLGLTVFVGLSLTGLDKIASEKAEGKGAKEFIEQEKDLKNPDLDIQLSDQLADIKNTEEAPKVEVSTDAPSVPSAPIPAKVDTDQ